MSNTVDGSSEMRTEKWTLDFTNKKSVIIVKRSYLVVTGGQYD